MIQILPRLTCQTFLRHTSAVLGAVLIAAAASASALAAPSNVDPANDVDRYLGAQMRKLRIPGMAIAVVKDGRIVLSRSYGTASVEFAQPVGENTVFAINSMTNAFTGVAAMCLVQQGRLDPSTPVGPARRHARTDGRDRCRRRLGVGPAAADPRRAW